MTKIKVKTTYLHRPGYVSVCIQGPDRRLPDTVGFRADQEDYIESSVEAYCRKRGYEIVATEHFDLRRETRESPLSRLKRTLGLAVIVFALLVPGIARAEGGGVINVNTATQSQLELLYRVGPALSERILDARAEGDYADGDDLQARVSGIGPKTVELNECALAFEGESTRSTKVSKDECADEQGGKS